MTQEGLIAHRLSWDLSGCYTDFLWQWEDICCRMGFFFWDEVRILIQRKNKEEWRRNKRHEEAVGDTIHLHHYSLFSLLSLFICKKEIQERNNFLIFLTYSYFYTLFSSNLIFIFCKNNHRKVLKCVPARGHQHSWKGSVISLNRKSHLGERFAILKYCWTSEHIICVSLLQLWTCRVPTLKQLSLLLSLIYFLNTFFCLIANPSANSSRTSLFNSSFKPQLISFLSQKVFFS